MMRLDDANERRQKHRQRHRELHLALVELAADYANHHRGTTLARTNVMQLIAWSQAQCDEPDELPL